MGALPVTTGGHDSWGRVSFCSLEESAASEASGTVISDGSRSRTSVWQNLPGHSWALHPQMSRRPSRRGVQEDGEDGPGGSRPRPELPRERAAPRESHPGTEPEPGLCGWCGGLPGRRAERLRGQGGTQLQPLRAAPRPLALVSQAPPPCPGPLDSGAPASPKCGHHVACLGPCPRPTLLERSLFSLCPVRVWVPLRVKHRPWPTAAPEPVTGQLGNTVGGPPVGGSGASEPFPAGAGVTKPQRAPASLCAVQQR